MALTRTFQDTVDLPRARDEVFAFFSAPRNLERLTPLWMGFRIREPFARALLAIRLGPDSLDDTFTARLRGQRR